MPPWVLVPLFRWPAKVRQTGEGEGALNLWNTSENASWRMQMGEGGKSPEINRLPPEATTRKVYI